MTHMIKVYGDDPKQVSEIPGTRVVARYPAFLLVEADDAAATTLSEGRLTEDITEQYQLDHDGVRLDTSIPRTAASGQPLPHPDYEAAPALPRRPHHYIVQFIGPIKKTWLNQVRNAGAEIVAPHSGFGVIARMSLPAVAKVAKLPVVRWLGHLPYEARLSRHLREYGAPETVSADPKTPRTRYVPGVYTVQFFEADKATAAQASVKRLGFQILEHVAGAPLLIVRAKSEDPDQVNAQLQRLSS